MWKYLIREIKYIKCRFKEKHFLWFLALSSPCVSHFHFFTYIFNQLSTRFYPNSLHSHSISRITTLIFCIPHIPFRILTFPPWFPTLLLPFPPWFPTFSSFPPWFPAFPLPFRMLPSFQPSFPPYSPHPIP